jgi:hypothetical protein
VKADSCDDGVHIHSVNCMLSAGKRRVAVSAVGTAL